MKLLLFSATQQKAIYEWTPSETPFVYDGRKGGKIGPKLDLIHLIDTPKKEKESIPLHILNQNEFQEAFKKGIKTCTIRLLGNQKHYEFELKEGEFGYIIEEGQTFHFSRTFNKKTYYYSPILQSTQKKTSLTLLEQKGVWIDKENSEQGFLFIKDKTYKVDLKNHEIVSLKKIENGKEYSIATSLSSPLFPFLSPNNYVAATENKKLKFIESLDTDLRLEIGDNLSWKVLLKGEILGDLFQPTFEQQKKLKNCFGENWAEQIIPIKSGEKEKFLLIPYSLKSEKESFQLNQGELLAEPQLLEWHHDRPLYKDPLAPLYVSHQLLLEAKNERNPTKREELCRQLLEYHLPALMEFNPTYESRKELFELIKKWDFDFEFGDQKGIHPLILSLNLRFLLASKEIVKKILTKEEKQYFDKNILQTYALYEAETSQHTKEGSFFNKYSNYLLPELLKKEIYQLATSYLKSIESLTNPLKEEMLSPKIKHAPFSTFSEGDELFLSAVNFFSDSPRTPKPIKQLAPPLNARDLIENLWGYAKEITDQNISAKDLSHLLVPCRLPKNFSPQEKHYWNQTERKTREYLYTLALMNELLSTKEALQEDFNTTFKNSQNDLLRGFNTFKKSWPSGHNIEEPKFDNENEITPFLMIPEQMNRLLNTYEDVRKDYEKRLQNYNEQIQTLENTLQRYGELSKFANPFFSYIEQETERCNSLKKEREKFLEQPIHIFSKIFDVSIILSPNEELNNILTSLTQAKKTLDPIVSPIREKKKKLENINRLERFQLNAKENLNILCNQADLEFQIRKELFTEDDNNPPNNKDLLLIKLALEIPPNKAELVKLLTSVTDATIRDTNDTMDTDIQKEVEDFIKLILQTSHHLKEEARDFLLTPPTLALPDDIAKKELSTPSSTTRFSEADLTLFKNQGLITEEESEYIKNNFLEKNEELIPFLAHLKHLSNERIFYKIQAQDQINKILSFNPKREQLSPPLSKLDLKIPPNSFSSLFQSSFNFQGICKQTQISETEIITQADDRNKNILNEIISSSEILESSHFKKQLEKGKEKILIANPLEPSPSLKPDQLDSFEKSLTLLQNDLNKEIQSKVTVLLHMVKVNYQTMPPSIKLSLEQDSSQEILIEKLIWEFHKKSFAYNNNFTQLEQNISQYLILSIQLKSLQQGGKKINELKELKNTYDQSNNLLKRKNIEKNWNLVSQELADFLSRCQDLNILKTLPENLKPHLRTLLFIMHSTGKVLRDDQAKTISDFIDNPRILTPMETGSGKTSTILPHVLLILGSQGNNAIGLVPETLFASNLKQLDDTTRTLLKLNGNAFLFSRNDLEFPLKEEGFQQFIQKASDFLKALEKGEYTLSTVESRTSIKNKRLEIELMIANLNRGNISKEPIKSQLEYSIQAAKVLKKLEKVFTDPNTKLIVDESDSSIRSNYSINSELGEKIKIPASLCQISEELMHLITYSEDTEIQELKNLLSENNQINISEEKKNEFLKALGEKWLEKSYPKISAVQKQKLLDWFIGKELSIPLDDFEDSIKLCYLRRALNTTMRTCLGFKLGKNVAYDPKYHAAGIPLLGDTPSPFLRYSDPLMQLLLSYTLAFYQPQGKEYLSDNIGFIETSLEQKINTLSSMQATKSEMKELDDLKTALEEIQALRQKMKTGQIDLEAEFAGPEPWKLVARLCVVKALTENKHLYMSSQQCSQSSLSAISGANYCLMTGTTSQEQELLIQLESGKTELEEIGLKSSIRSLRLLAEGLEAFEEQKVLKQHVKTFSTKSEKALDQMIFYIKNDGYRAIINHAGAASDSSLDDLITTLSKNTEKNVIYLDRSGKKYYCSANGKRQLLEALEEKKQYEILNQAVFYYSPMQTRGVDFTMPIGTKAIALVSPDVDLNALCQLIGRPRKLGKGHTLDIAISEKHAEFIKKDKNVTYQNFLENVFKISSHSAEEGCLSLYTSFIKNSFKTGAEEILNTVQEKFDDNIKSDNKKKLINERVQIFHTIEKAFINSNEEILYLYSFLQEISNKEKIATGAYIDSFINKQISTISGTLSNLKDLQEKGNSLVDSSLINILNEKKIELENLLKKKPWEIATMKSFLPSYTSGKGLSASNIDYSTEQSQEESQEVGFATVSSTQTQQSAKKMSLLGNSYERPNLFTPRELFEDAAMSTFTNKLHIKKITNIAKLIQKEKREDLAGMWVIFRDKEGKDIRSHFVLSSKDEAEQFCRADNRSIQVPGHDVYITGSVFHFHPYQGGYLNLDNRSLFPGTLLEPFNKSFDKISLIFDLITSGVLNLSEKDIQYLGECINKLDPNKKKAAIERVLNSLNTHLLEQPQEVRRIQEIFKNFLRN